MEVAIGRPIRVRVAKLIQEILAGAPARDTERLALLSCATHGVIALQVNKPTLRWSEAAPLAVWWTS